MKRAFIFTGIIVLIMLSVFTRGYAYGTPYGGHFMRVESRDANNRVLQSRAGQSEIFFESTAYYNAYSMLSPFGSSARYQRSGSSSMQITNQKIFRVGLVAVPFLYREAKSFFNHIKNLLAKGNPFFSANLLLLFLLTVLIFESQSQTTEEPRFRVPVFIE
ncbi:MAG: hypothetical protein PF545_02810 [Elusimicrobia bacterium]|jgi:hypothetical protein|nr:hypothetical protein [Elusimicrobiota bacterium]